MEKTTFSLRLKELREARLPQNEFANLLGVTARAVRRYESGEREPEYDVLIKIALYFGVTTDYLLGLSDDPKKSKAHKPGTDLSQILQASKGEDTDQ